MTNACELGFNCPYCIGPDEDGDLLCIHPNLKPKKGDIHLVMEMECPLIAWNSRLKDILKAYENDSDSLDRAVIKINKEAEE